MNLNQVTVGSTDVAASAAFYRSLGLTQIVESLPKYARFECPGGGSTFSVHKVESMPATLTTVVYFECEDLDRKVEELKSKGVRFDTGPVDQSWLWREAYLKDPDGNVICLYYAGENRLNPPWRLIGDEL
jgi:catechol 2,3-dioxygenase-like lactoylglutathione lyase family enzyme